MTFNQDPITGRILSQGATQRSKECLQCGKTFYCPYGCGISNWEPRKYCSMSCVSKSQTLESKTCPQCGIEFTPERRSQKYCTRECSRTVPTPKGDAHFNAKRLNFHCVVCESEMRVTPSQYHVRMTCSKDCSSIWKSLIRQSGRKKRNTHNSTQYNRWRRAVVKRDNYSCVTCGASDLPIHAHHIKHWRSYPELRFDVANGMTLCVFCHAKSHPKVTILQSLAASRRTN